MDLSTDEDNNNVVFDENNNEYMIPEFSDEEKQSNKSKEQFSITISPSLLNYYTYELIKNHVMEKNIKEHNTIKVYYFYLKKKYKYKESIQLYNKSKFQYFFKYVFNITRKYIVKDLRKILVYTVGIFFAEKLAEMTYKLIKKKRMLRKK